MAGAFDFAREFALAARAVAGLAARFDFAAFADVTRERVEVFVIEAFAFGAVGVSAALPPASSPAPTGPPAAGAARRSRI